MINWGIFGTGMIARALAVSIRDSEGSNLKAVASRSIEKAERFAEKYNCLAIEGYENLLNIDDLDAIYVATPHDSHFDLALASIEAKKSVLCEKPMTINSTEAMVLIDAARNHGVLLMEAFMYRTHPQTDKIRELVETEFNDKPLTIEASFGFSAEVPKEHRLVNPELGGGSIMDIGCYPMSMSRMVVGAQLGKPFTNPISIGGTILDVDSTLDFPETGKLIIAHGGNLKPSDLNRQLLMKDEALGSSRIDCAMERLKELNPRLEIIGLAENVTESNISSLVSESDLVVDCAPLFEERYLMNREAFAQGKPIVECSMFEMEAHITSFKPGLTGCLQCL